VLKTKIKKNVEKEVMTVVMSAGTTFSR